MLKKQHLAIESYETVISHLKFVSTYSLKVNTQIAWLIVMTSSVVTSLSVKRCVDKRRANVRMLLVIGLAAKIWSQKYRGGGSIWPIWIPSLKLIANLVVFLLCNQILSCHRELGVYKITTYFTQQNF